MLSLLVRVCGACILAQVAVRCGAVVCAREFCFRFVPRLFLFRSLTGTLSRCRRFVGPLVE